MLGLKLNHVSERGHWFQCDSRWGKIQLKLCYRSESMITLKTKEAKRSWAPDIASTYVSW